MPTHKFSFVLNAALAVLAASLLAPGYLVAQQEGTLHNFGSGQDGSTLYGGVISDASGNLYGTTFAGGPFNNGQYGSGIVFELSPQKGGGWTETVLHNFGGATDGWGPTAGLVFDTAGNLYGTTQYGGGNTFCPGGCGIVFQLRPPAVQGGAWTESIIYRFKETYRGDNPQSGLVVDSSGNVYGTTFFGGNGAGTVFELSPKKGLWSERVLYAFVADSSTGSFPNAALIFDSSGNLFGTTSQGGTSNAGTVFELTPKITGAWGYKVLYSFNSTAGDGTDPVGSLIVDSGGNLYGATGEGGEHQLGTVFELTPSGGSWTEHILYSFGASSTDGSFPEGGLLMDAAGNLFGETEQGGSYGGGTLFELAPSNGTWTEHLLHSFGNATDGKFPWGGLLFTPGGNIFGVCAEGGAYYTTKDQGGTVFEVRLK
jgi:uncharacterized repeat protein (TIGR03803 family)